MAHYSGLWSGCEGLMTPKYVSSLKPLKDFDFTVCPVSLSDKLEGQKQGRSAVWTDTCVSFFPTLHIHLQVLGPIQRWVGVCLWSPTNPKLLPDPDPGDGGEAYSEREKDRKKSGIMRVLTESAGTLADLHMNVTPRRGLHAEAGSGAMGRQDPGRCVRTFFLEAKNLKCSQYCTLKRIPKVTAVWE